MTPLPLFSGVRWQIPYITYEQTPPSGSGDFFLDAEVNQFAVMNTAGLKLHLPPNRVLLYDTTPNDGAGGFAFDLTTHEGQRCRDLEIYFGIRGNFANTFDSLMLYYNDDNEDANYRYSYASANEASAAVACAGAATAFMAFVVANTGPSNEYSMGRMLISDYRSPTTLKHMQLRMSYGLTTTSLNTFQLNHRWTVNAIRKISMRVDGAPTDTLNSNSRVVVIGHKY